MIRPTSLRVTRTKVKNVNKALVRIISLPLVKRATTIRVFNNNLIRVEEQL